MYLDFYGLQKEPFHITPDPEFLFLSPSHKEALGSIIYGIKKRKGFVSIIGEVGTGKTTVIRSYLKRAHLDRVKPIYVFNSNISFAELVRTIFREIGVICVHDDLYNMINQLHEILIQEYMGGNNIVLFVDEAQNMPVETLEKLRMLSNLETTKEKLIQIVLVGQPEFEKKLNLVELRQLKQRLAIRATILPLSQQESFDYIRHRLSIATANPKPILKPRAMKRIVKSANGTPRLLNILCDNALITGLGCRKKSVSSKIVREVITDYKGTRRSHPLFTRKFALVTGLILLMGIFVSSLNQEALFSKVKNMGSPQKNQVNHVGLANYTKDKKKVMDMIMTLPDMAKIIFLNLSTYVCDHFFREGQTPAITDFKPEKHETIPLFQQDQLLAVSPFLPIAADLINAQTEDRAFEIEPVEQMQDKSALNVKNGSQITRIVKKGDCLTELCIDTYDFSNSRVLRWIKENNPWIKDVDIIEVGDRIIFPKLDTKKFSELLKE